MERKHKRQADEYVGKILYNYLITIHKDEKSQRWIVDQDSEHILGNNYLDLKLQVYAIRALTPTPEQASGWTEQAHKGARSKDIKEVWRKFACTNIRSALGEYIPVDEFVALLDYIDELEEKVAAQHSRLLACRLRVARVGGKT